MAKKEGRFNIKSFFNGLMEKSLQGLISVAAEQSEHLIDLLKNIPLIKKKIRRIVISAVFLTAGLVIFGLGAGLYLANLLGLSTSSSYMMVGLAFLISAGIYSHTSL